jgi:UDP-N-acetyl-D-galactosamine dehydrogenase
MATQERIAVIGLGYVGLPLAIAFARHFEHVTGFDIDEKRVTALKAGDDVTGEVSRETLLASDLTVTSDPDSLEGCTFVAITVPTPVDKNRRPDLGPIMSACRTVAAYLTEGTIVALESTVYPGVTEEVCGPLLAELSGLELGRDIKLAYSPERINPGDREHVLDKIVKVVSAQDDETMERVAAVYGAVTEAGVFKASSIKVAESAKVIENTQRDLNIALMNELAIIFDRLDISTRDVLAAANTKWNFLPFTPGLVGGHCIGVDPYYITARAEEAGYHPEVILAGRRINDTMGAFVAERLVKMLLRADLLPASAKIGIIGLAFKEDVPDLRNTRVVDIIAALTEYGIRPLIADPLVDPDEATAEYGVELVDLDALDALDALILAVPHRAVLKSGSAGLVDRLKDGGILMDIKAAMEPSTLPASVAYWSL